MTYGKSQRSQRSSLLPWSRKYIHDIYLPIIVNVNFTGLKSSMYNYPCLLIEKYIVVVIHLKPTNLEIFCSWLQFFKFVKSQDSSAKKLQVQFNQDQVGRLILIGWPMGKRSDLRGRRYYLDRANRASKKR